MSIRLKDTIYDKSNDSDKLDGYHASSFSQTDHTHNYTSKIKIGSSTTEYSCSSNLITLPAYPTIPTIPTKISSFENDSGYTTNTGTVTNVSMTVPTGLTVSGSGITTSGTLKITFTSGYSIPTTTKQTNWDTAYGWGNHASAGYAKSTDLGNYLPLTGGTLDGRLTIRAKSSSDDSWLSFSNKTDSNIHRIGIRRPESEYGLQYYNGSDYYRIYHSGNISTLKSNLGLGSNAYTSTSYQPLSTAINTGNIGSQSVNFATSADKLSTVSKTAWGQTYWTSGGIPTNISGNLSNVGSITRSEASAVSSDSYGNLVWNSGATDTSSWNIMTTSTNRQFTVYKTGEVGIGTISPTHKLHVMGDILSSATLKTDWNNWKNMSTAYNRFDLNYCIHGSNSEHVVPGWSTRNMLGWRDAISGEGYYTNYTIGSYRRASGWGGIHLSVSNSDDANSIGGMIEIEGTGMIALYNDVSVGNTLLCQGPLLRPNHGIHMKIVDSLGWNGNTIIESSWNETYQDYIDIRVPGWSENSNKYFRLNHWGAWINGNLILTTANWQNYITLSSSATNSATHYNITRNGSGTYNIAQMFNGDNDGTKYGYIVEAALETDAYSAKKLPMFFGWRGGKKAFQISDGGIDIYPDSSDFSCINLCHNNGTYYHISTRPSSLGSNGNKISIFYYDGSTHHERGWMTKDGLFNFSAIAVGGEQITFVT